MWHRTKNIQLNHPIDKLDSSRYVHLQILESQQDREVLPAKFSLVQTQLLPPVDDQGSLGSCVSHSVAKLLEYNLKRTATPKSAAAPTMSRLYIYYGGRYIASGSPPMSRYRDPGDVGLYIQDGFRSVQTYSDCVQTLWPYKIANYKVPPPPEVVANAKANYKMINYINIPTNLQRLKSQLVSGNPISYGFRVYSSFMTQKVASSGIIPIPNTRTEKLLGGHSMLITGYDDVRACFQIMNSWGTNWGIKGFAWFPYSYMLNLAGEFFTTTTFIQLPKSVSLKPRLLTFNPKSSSSSSEDIQQQKRGPSLPSTPVTNTEKEQEIQEKDIKDFDEKPLTKIQLQIPVERYLVEKKTGKELEKLQLTLFYENSNPYDELRPGWSTSIQEIIKCFAYSKIEKIDLRFRVYKQPGKPKRKSKVSSSKLFEQKKQDKQTEYQRRRSKLSILKTKDVLLNSWDAFDAWQNLEEKQRDTIRKFVSSHGSTLLETSSSSCFSSSPGTEDDLIVFHFWDF